MNDFWYMCILKEIQYSSQMIKKNYDNYVKLKFMQMNFKKE